MIPEEMKIKVGDQVMVYFSANEQTSNPARKFNGQKFVVKTIQMPRGPKGRKQFTLYGAEEAGMPYWFLEDELVKL